MSDLERLKGGGHSLYYILSYKKVEPPSKINLYVLSTTNKNFTYTM